jgi:hypothetical protein
VEHGREDLISSYRVSDIPLDWEQYGDFRICVIGTAEARFSFHT